MISVDEKITGESNLTFKRIWSGYIKPYSHGCTLHYTMLQPGIQIFRHRNGIIAYTIKQGTHFILSEPVCKYKTDEELGLLVGDFLTGHPDSVFVYISQGFADFLYRNFNIRSTQVGVERSVNLKNWSISGRHKQSIRTSVNRAVREGIQIKENYNEPALKQNLDQWIRTRKLHNKRIGFILRERTFFEPDTRTFCAYSAQKKLLGHIQFTPIYKSGKLKGYMPEISSASLEFHQGIFYVIMVYAMNVFVSEGVEEVNLGLAPLVSGHETAAYESPVFKKAIKLFSKIHIYNFEGINFTKSRFVYKDEVHEGIENKIYLSHQKKLPLHMVWKLSRLINII